MRSTVSSCVCRPARSDMRRRALLSLPFALLVAGVAASAIADDGWKLEKDADGIRIESRAAPGWSIHEMRGTARIDAPLSAVAAVIDGVPGVTKLPDLVTPAEHRKAGLWGNR